MNANLKKLAAALAIAGASVSGSAFAMSGTDTATPFSVANNVNFQIIIPAFLYFRVGVNTATPDSIVFTVPAATVGTGAVASTGGDAGGTASNVAIRGNNGQVTITATVSAATGLGTGTASDGFINFNTITATASNANLTAPGLTNAGGGTSTPLLGCDVACPGLGKVTNRTGTWTWSYANATVPSAGNYTGVATYTATMP
ncbi:hypothetical protein [Usitatibacter palustris]|uniref:Uncharacterized protein n=1 Tax=Usitatibacter palustris TaxID=2732487 RepID=A0A6M4H2T4_9PROT|nr:hypothetical protein [Usitatibacter palustris]QJR13881.1 hypothetical protein DSM104440_00671 [Usitatibacter palustris]